MSEVKRIAIIGAMDSEITNFKWYNCFRGDNYGANIKKTTRIFKRKIYYK